MTTSPTSGQNGETAVPATDTGSADFQRYYEEAGPDYASWSPNYNMHFGYFQWGMNPLRRERMLERMNREVLDRLRIASKGAADVLDMGCGLGATLRSIGRQLPQGRLTGLTLVPWQVERGRLLNKNDPTSANIQISLGDYEHTALPSASFDGAYALESSCYAHGANKAAFLLEAHRLLRPGGRLVMADGFLTSNRRLIGPQRSAYRKLCECWVIETLGDVDQCTAELARLGFTEIKVERLQYRVAPSVFHVPWVTLKFLIVHVLFGKRRMTKARWNNILAPVLLPFVGHPVGPMIYCMVSATKA